MKTLPAASAWFLLISCLPAVGSPSASDDSTNLGRAMEISLHTARPDGAIPGAWRLHNRTQRMSTRITPGGAEFRVIVQERPLRFRWLTTGIGYGEDLTPVETGTVKAPDATEGRVEIRRPGFVEWFVNRPEGLEHGYTVTTPPVHREPGKSLRVEMALEGDLVVDATSTGDRVILRPETGGPGLHYEKLKVWDANQRILEARLTGGGRRLAIEVDDAEAVYPVTIDPVFVQQARLDASNGAFSGDTFGFSVDISGDTAIVGARFEDGSATTINGADDDLAGNAGAAYIFVRNTNAEWVEQVYLKASNAAAGDFFGHAVAIDGNTAAVGAPLEDGNSASVEGNYNDARPDAGAVYVFVRTFGVWTQQAYLKAANAGAGDEFGSDIDIDQDTLIIGAPKESGSAFGVNGANDDLAPEAGAAYVFVRAGNSWTQQAYLKAINTESGDNFGTAVGISGDDAVVGAPEESSNATGVDGDPGNNGKNGSGAVYAYLRTGLNWANNAYLKASNSGAGDAFGSSVSIDTWTIVGAPSEDGSSAGVDGPDNDDLSQAGAVYVFTRDGSWLQVAYLKASNPGDTDQFGVDVATQGTDVVVGAQQEDGGSTGINGPTNELAANSGAAYRFRLLPGPGIGTWTQQAYLKAGNPEPGDRFGQSVALSLDVTLVGAPVADGGAAFVFDLPGITSVAAPKKFKSTVIGSKSKRQTITITNTGISPLIGLTTKLTGKGKRDFIAGKTVGVLAPGATTSIKVTFKPKKTGKRLADLVFSSNADPVTVKLKGKGK